MPTPCMISVILMFQYIYPMPHKLKLKNCSSPPNFFIFLFHYYRNESSACLIRLHQNSIINWEKNTHKSKSTCHYYVAIKVTKVVCHTIYPIQLTVLFAKVIRWTFIRYYFFIFQIVKNPVSRRNLTYSRCESFLWIHRKYLYTTWNCDTNKLIISPFHLTVHMMISKSTNFPHLIDKDFYSVQKKRKKKKNKSLGTNSFIKPYRLLGKMRFILFSSDFTLNIWL